jgi:hypothetical protein
MDFTAPQHPSERFSLYDKRFPSLFDTETDTLLLFNETAETRILHDDSAVLLETSEISDGQTTKASPVQTPDLNMESDDDSEEYYTEDESEDGYRLKANL